MIRNEAKFNLKTLESPTEPFQTTPAIPKTISLTIYKQQNKFEKKKKTFLSIFLNLSICFFFVVAERSEEKKMFNLFSHFEQLNDSFVRPNGYFLISFSSEKCSR